MSTNHSEAAIRQPAQDASKVRNQVGWPVVLAAGLASALVCWLFLHQLGAQPLQKWDEARLALNALYIGRRHDWLVMYCGSYPDSLNTKPPVLPVLQALCYAVFGVSTWALRLPSAVAGGLTAGTLLLFAWKVLRRPWVGITAALVLATMPGFNGYHVARTGEYDALLTLGTAGYCLSAYAYLQRPSQHYLRLFGLALAGALLVKCSAALLPLPGLLLYVWRYAPATLRDRRVWVAGAAAFGPLLLFYAVREWAYPGYLHFTWDNDWAGRVARPLTAATPGWYYLPALWQGLSFWAVAVGVGAGLLWWPTKKASPVVRFAFWQVAVLLPLVSLAQTRLPWYVAHAYPLLALAISTTFADLTIQLPQQRKLLVSVFALLGICAGLDTVRRHQQAAEAPLAAAQRYPAALRQLNQVQLSGSEVIVLSEGYNPILDYYLLTEPPPRRLELTIQRLYEGKAEAIVRELLPGQQVLGCDPPYRRLVEQQFRTTPLATLGFCWCLRLGQRRSRSPSGSPYPPR